MASVTAQSALGHTAAAATNANALLILTETMSLNYLRRSFAC